MDKLKELFKLLNRRQFLITKCWLDPDGGINHRLLGKGTNAKDKKTDLTETDKEKIKAGLGRLVEDINNVIEIL